ncbi:MAG: ECF transporter S component [Candidatus Eremiobacteraeota bacterium]|nr:ECF transporter S component [Candidatus Eremiobacteraeota bacterium]
MRPRIPIRQIALTGIMLGICAILVSTPLGMIPVPTPARYATIMHVPVIIVGILEGPIVGGIMGLLFGLIAFAKVPEFGPIVHLLPRPFVGIIPALLYGGLSYLFRNYQGKLKDTLIIAIATFTGSMVNTLGVLGLAVILMPKLMPKSVALVIGLTSGIPEAIFSVLIAVPVVLAIKKKFAYQYLRTEEKGSLQH